MAVTDFREQKYLFEEYFLGDFLLPVPFMAKQSCHPIYVSVLKIIKSICLGNSIGWNSERKAEAEQFFGAYLVIHSINES